MLFLGRIEPLSETAKIDSNNWMSLIDSQDSLRHVSPRMGINPFTRQPCEYKAPTSTALIVANGADIGSISWAMDGSPFLIVQAQTETIESVVVIAEDVATRLGARFVREDG